MSNSPQPPRPTVRLGGRLLILAVVLAAPGCSDDGVDGGWTCDATVDVTGVWDVSRTGQPGSGITCLDVETSWTLLQNGCDVTIVSESWDPANGAVGTLSGNRLFVEWTRYEGCYRYDEELDVTVEGDSMDGTYYLARTQAVYPADCPGTGLCSASVSGTRRTP